MTITISTKIADGIYRSQGGGQTRTRAEAATNPRNLLRLAAHVATISKASTVSYGNIGHAGTWLEIDGTVIDRFDLADLAELDQPAYVGAPVKTRTAKAKELIASVQSGEYAEARRRAVESLDAYIASHAG